METQIYSYFKTPKGLKVVTIFGYATRGVPGLEISGFGKLSKNIKEKLIYITRIRKLKLPTKRFVICIDINDFDHDNSSHDLKWLEFPALLLFWYLAGLIPIKKLDDCICAGWINTNGDIYQNEIPAQLKKLLIKKTNPVLANNTKLITSLAEVDHDFWSIDSAMLLEHMSGLNFKFDYIESDSATPIKSCIA